MAEASEKGLGGEHSQSQAYLQFENNIEKQFSPCRRNNRKIRRWESNFRNRFGISIHEMLCTRRLGRKIDAKTSVPGS